MNIEDFVKKQREKKVSDMMGMVLDMGYYKEYLKVNDEDKAREDLNNVTRELKVINASVQINKQGKIVKDWRDPKRLAKLNADNLRLNNVINKITKIKNQLLECGEIIEEFVRYIGIIDGLEKDKELSDKLKELAKL